MTNSCSFGWRWFLCMNWSKVGQALCIASTKKCQPRPRKRFYNSRNYTHIAPWPYAPRARHSASRYQTIPRRVLWVESITFRKIICTKTHSLLVQLLVGWLEWKEKPARFPGLPQGLSCMFRLLYLEYTYSATWIMFGRLTITSTVPDSSSNHANTVHGKRRAIMKCFVGICVCIEHGKKRRTTMKEATRNFDKRSREIQRSTHTFEIDPGLLSQ